MFERFRLEILTQGVSLYLQTVVYYQFREQLPAHSLHQS